jgi:hypothetical protein
MNRLREFVLSALVAAVVALGALLLKSPRLPPALRTAKWALAGMPNDAPPRTLAEPVIDDTRPPAHQPELYAPRREPTYWG